MKMLEQLAEETAREGEKEGFSLNPITVMLVLIVLSELFKLYKECQKNKEDVVASCREMPETNRRLIKREVRKQMGVFKYYLGSGAKIVDKIVARAKKITYNEVDQLYNESQ